MKKFFQMCNTRVWKNGSKFKFNLYSRSGDKFMEIPWTNRKLYTLLLKLGKPCIFRQNNIQEATLNQLPLLFENSDIFSAKKI